MIGLVRDWLVFNALRWPTLLLCLIGVVVVPPIAVYSYFYWGKRALEASE